MINNKSNLFIKSSKIVYSFTPKGVKKHPGQVIMLSMVLICLQLFLRQSWVTDVISSRIEFYAIKATIWYLIPSIFMVLKLVSINVLLNESMEQGIFNSRRNYIIIFLALFSLLHLISGLTAYRSQALNAIVLFSLIIPFVYIMQLLADFEKEKVLISISLGICISASLLFIACFLWEPLTRAVYTGIFVDPNGFSEFLCAAIISSYYIIEKTKKNLFWLYSIVFVSMGMILFSRSRTGALIAVASTAVWILLSKKTLITRIKIIPLILIGFFSAILFSELVFSQVTYPLNESLNFVNRTYRTIRTEAFENANQQFSENQVKIAFPIRRNTHTVADMPNFFESFTLFFQRFEGINSSTSIDNARDQKSSASPPTIEDQKSNASPPTIEDEKSNASPPTIEDEKSSTSKPLPKKETNLIDKNNGKTFDFMTFSSSRTKIWKEFLLRITLFGRKNEYIYISGYGQGSTNLAHNVFLQIGSDIGGIAAMIFIFLDVLLIWDVMKSIFKNSSQNKANKVILLYKALILVYFNIYALLYSNNYIYGSISYYLFFVTLGLYYEREKTAKSFR